MGLREGRLRSDEMTSQQRMTALVKGQPLDRVPFVPFILGFAAHNVGMSLAAFYSDAQKCYEASVLTRQQYDLDGSPVLGYADYGGWEFGGKGELPTGPYDQCLKVVQRPVQTEKDAWNLELPEVETSGFLPILMKFSQQQFKNEGRATCPGMEPFAIASSTTGVEKFCRWMNKKPEVCHHLLRLAVAHRLQVLEYWIDTFGIQNIRYDTATGPESNYLISPQAFKEFVFPYTKALHEKVLSRGIRSIFLHMCGDHNLNLPYWRDIPFGDPGMISFGPEVDLDTAIEVFGEDTIIFGNLSPTTIMTGTPEVVYQQTKQCLDKGKKSPARLRFDVWV